MRRHARPGPCFLYVLRMSGAEAHRAFGADLSGLAPGDVLRMLGLHV
ncbi:hypothetical protein [Thermomonas sp. XSG]|jgi:hypothetical protein|nr:hypothetical protein [Thermomonas sp. XSG]QNU14956.1 hypothetical protein ICG51_001276 [Thermomonas sp. XSG]